jgi:hypothetical protein
LKYLKAVFKKAPSAVSLDDWKKAFLGIFSPLKLTDTRQRNHRFAVSGFQSSKRKSGAFAPLVNPFFKLVKMARLTGIDYFVPAL